MGYSNTDLVTGYWQTIDSKTKKPNSIIHVKKNGEFYEGVIEKTYVTPYEQRTHRCMHCVGNKKDQLILGLTIIEHMTCSQGLCKGGTVLDPRNGNLYHATMRVINAGKQLRLRGYIGIPLFGKSVIWNRVTGKE
ncbi:MAG: hypothetical protein A3E84_00715 [Gammaproteobacteria bacterium RIFCSPHIGHO2_12_FULL_42_13]|nr:MAG: hypothetical protein A3E84_00715 [Gammaproteobacteria bacterium RIFCSPHIGHO2_12_FULL_42_13]